MFCFCICYNSLSLYIYGSDQFVGSPFVHAKTNPSLAAYLTEWAGE